MFRPETLVYGAETLTGNSCQEQKWTGCYIWRWQLNWKRGTGLVLREERNTRVGGGQARVIDKSSVHFVAWVREHATGHQFVYAVLVLIAKSSGLRMLMAAPNREWEKDLRLKLAAGWADISHALKRFYELPDALIVLDEVLCLEVLESGEAIAIQTRNQPRPSRGLPLNYELLFCRR